MQYAAKKNLYVNQAKSNIYVLQGDSGGPLHQVMDDGRYKQIGITSFGLVFGCELGLHAAFTRTSQFVYHTYFSISIRQENSCRFLRQSKLVVT